MLVALAQCCPQKLQNHFYALIYDQWHVSARGLRYLHEKSGADERYLAIFIISGISIYLIIGDYARFVANTILTVVPILLTYVYPEEKPPSDNLLCYWFIYFTTTLFLDPALEDKGSYYWMKMLLLALLIAFPVEAEVTKNESNQQEEIMTISNKNLSEKDISDQRLSSLSKESMPATIRQNQIHSEKREIPPLALQLDSRTESSILTNDESLTTPIRESLIVSENKPYVFQKDSRTALREKSELTTEKDQFNQAPKKSHVLQGQKFLDISILKPEIISVQEVPTSSIRESQMLPADELRIAHEETLQLAPVKISQSGFAKQNEGTFSKGPQTFPAWKPQLTCSKEHDNIYAKTVQKLPIVLVTDSTAVPVKKCQVTPLKESEDSIMKESKIDSSSDEEIQTACVKDYEAIHSKQLKISTEKKFQEGYLNVPVRKCQNILPDVPKIISTNAVSPLRISTATFTEQSQNISNKEIEKPQFVLQHEAVSVEKPQVPVAPSVAVRVPMISVKEGQTLHEKESHILPTFKTDPVVQNPSHAELQAFSLKESDIVTEAETQVNHTEEIITSPEKQSLSTSDASTDPEKSGDSNTVISQDTSERKKSTNVITWVATGKTVVLIQNVQTEKASLLQISY
ncbi:hypothetical protein LOAG_11293 [Loa loa]|uniref:Uncharacterized protein n=1 Tax=Loa loa TaxID=7209 RepID=A0A1S0TN57_LOALO|nr:hypothetical protein LOAG_11293 [Loa loa]EFO17207.2 hypothetical protein LOAG_11293 [Loa loa]